LRIPSDFAKLQQHDPSAAQAWRYHVRACAEAAFAANYVVVDFIRSESQYVLVKPDA